MSFVVAREGRTWTGHVAAVRHHVAKVNLPDTSGVSISPLPRRSEKSNTAPFTQVEKEQLLLDFLEWRKQ